MLIRRIVKLCCPPLLGGDNVRIGIPKVDRGRSDPPSVIGVVTDINEHGSYKIGTKHGRVKGALSRNLVDKCRQNTFLSPEDVPDSELSIRQTAAQGSIGHGQGFLQCKCKTGCDSLRCTCKKKTIYFAIVAAIIALVVKINADLFHKPYVLFVVL